MRLALATVEFRPAQKTDSRAIATLYSIASDGVANYIWSQFAEPHETLIDVGQRRYEREGIPFSYQNATLATVEGAIAGMLVAYPIEGESEPDPQPDPVLAPYRQLEAPNSYYICGLAVFPDYRQQGIATHLMHLAEQQAIAKGLPQVSLIVFEQNTRAKRLYDRLGYREIKRVPVVPHPLIEAFGNALLMVKPLV
jgi:ribosomal protein S18 acetylase RimI-like enzyme